MTDTIEAGGLTKRFGGTQALRGVDLAAGPGTVLALLGPNGAGKTTAVRVLATLLKADAGQARICGYDVVTEAVQVRQLIALTGQFASVDDELTGTENMMMIGRLLGFSRATARARAAHLPMPLSPFSLNAWGDGGRNRDQRLPACSPAPGRPPGRRSAAPAPESSPAPRGSPGMAKGHTITTTPATSHVVVTLGGEKIAETDRPVLLDETGLPTRYYLPREDVRTDLLRATDLHTTCPFKGEASYWSAEVGGEVYTDLVWSYETPIPQAAQVAGLMCFYPDRVELTVDGQPA